MHHVYHYSATTRHMHSTGSFLPPAIYKQQQFTISTIKSYHSNPETHAFD